MATRGFAMVTLPFHVTDYPVYYDTSFLQKQCKKVDSYKFNRAILVNIAFGTRKKTRKKRKARRTFLCFPLFGLLSLDSHDLTAIVGTASLAGSVGHDGLAALGANRYAGSGQLPVGATALIAAGLGHFTLRNSHGDTSLVKLLFTAFILDLLLKKLLQSSKSGIQLLLAAAGAVVQVFAAALANAFAVLLAQQLGIQTQDENRPYNIVQIGAVSLQREYPLVFVLFVGQFRHQNHIDGEADFPAKISGASVAGAVDAGGDLTGHHENTRGVPHRALCRDRLGHRVADTVTKITQVNGCGKGD
jgi:hypothetical protein